MWGNHRRSSAYYSCQPSHQRSANIPAGHPAHVYLGEPALHEAVVGFLSTALFGPERQTYWRRRLADCGSKQPAAPVGERLKEVTTEVADLERRIERQIANLEAEDATPALRQRIAARIAELEEAVEDRRRRATALAQEVADAPPTAADLATALDQLPLLDRLPELPQPELRTLFDSLRLQVAFQPGEAAVDVEVALFADEPSDRRKEVAEVQSVPPGRTERKGRRSVGALVQVEVTYSLGGVATGGRPGS